MPVNVTNATASARIATTRASDRVGCAKRAVAGARIATAAAQIATVSARIASAGARPAVSRAKNAKGAVGDAFHRAREYKASAAFYKRGEGMG